MNPLYKLQMIRINKLLLCLLVVTVVVGLQGAMAQDKNSKKEVKESNVENMIAERKIIFLAQSVNPSRGRTMVQLNSQYDLAISRDTVRAFLPYFGRAYTAPMDGRGGGIDFISKNFEYTQKVKKKERWEILIKPKDVPDVRQLFLTIFTNGSASLRVLSNNRETISYNGYLKESRE